MPNSAPAWVRSVAELLAEAYSFNGGADAAKSASPAAKDIYLATDTKKLYICVADGSWTGFDASILVQGILTLYADAVAGGYKITGLGAPTAANDAARKTDVDTVDAKLDDVSQAQPTRVVTTIYQNTSGKFLLVTIAIQTAVASLLSARVDCDSMTPPTMAVGGASVHASYAATESITFMVPPNYYYRIIVEDGITIYKWTEWTIH